MAEEDEEDAVKTPAEQPPVGVVVPKDSYGGSPARQRTLLWRPFQASSLHHHHRAAASFLATLLSLQWRRLGPRIRPGEKLLVLF
ncbi:unnamed protein product [Gadus morhua 'NCC']